MWNESAYLFLSIKKVSLDVILPIQEPSMLRKCAENKHFSHYAL